MFSVAKHKNVGPKYYIHYVKIAYTRVRGGVSPRAGALLSICTFSGLWYTSLCNEHDVQWVVRGCSPSRVREVGRATASYNLRPPCLAENIHAIVTSNHINMVRHGPSECSALTNRLPVLVYGLSTRSKR